MNIWVPLVLLVMPMSVSTGWFLLLVAGVFLLALAGLYSGSLQADDWTRAALAVERLYAAARSVAGPHREAEQDRAIYHSRLAALAKLYAAARKIEAPDRSRNAIQFAPLVPRSLLR